MPMLKKMKMPKREEISVEELDMPAEGGEEEMASEGEEAPSAEAEGMADLAAISDEDLLAEMKKRGLMSEMSGEEMSMDMAEGGEEEVEDEDEMYS